jgi:hypothetical protein
MLMNLDTYIYIFINIYINMGNARKSYMHADVAVEGSNVRTNV